MARLPENPRDAKIVNVSLTIAWAILLLIDWRYYQVITTSWELFLGITGLFAFFMLVGSVTGGLLRLPFVRATRNNRWQR